MNIHPSLLPMFAGGMDKNVHQQVLEYGCKVTGCSLIFIDEGETVDSLKQKVQIAEQEIIVKGIELFRDKKIEVVGRKVKLGDKNERKTSNPKA